MRLVALFALPMIVAIVTPALSQDLNTTDPMIDTFKTSSVNPNPEDGSGRLVRKVRVAKIRSLETVAEVDVVTKPRKARYRPGMLLPAGMAF